MAQMLSFLWITILLVVTPFNVVGLDTIPINPSISVEFKINTSSVSNDSMSAFNGIMNTYTSTELRKKYFVTPYDPSKVTFDVEGQEYLTQEKKIRITMNGSIEWVEDSPLPHPKHANKYLGQAVTEVLKNTDFIDELKEINEFADVETPTPTLSPSSSSPTTSSPTLNTESEQINFVIEPEDTSNEEEDPTSGSQVATDPHISLDVFGTAETIPIESIKKFKDIVALHATTEMIAEYKGTPYSVSNVMFTDIQQESLVTPTNGQGARLTLTGYVEFEGSSPSNAQVNDRLERAMKKILVNQELLNELRKIDDMGGLETIGTSVTAAPIVSSPVASPTEASPVTSPTEASPVAFTTESSPVASTTESSPVASTTESSPVASTTEASPVASPPESSPVASSTESSPIASPTESSPVASPTEASPVASPTEASPVASPTEASPVASPTEASPVASTTEASPVASPTEASPVASPTESSPVASPISSSSNDGESSNENNFNDGSETTTTAAKITGIQAENNDRSTDNVPLILGIVIPIVIVALGIAAFLYIRKRGNNTTEQSRTWYHSVHTPASKSPCIQKAGSAESTASSESNHQSLLKSDDEENQSEEQLESITPKTNNSKSFNDNKNEDDSISTSQEDTSTIKFGCDDDNSLIDDESEMKNSSKKSKSKEGQSSNEIV